jgi:sugar phosphate isomerase/epimerase
LNEQIDETIDNIGPLILHTHFKDSVFEHREGESPCFRYVFFGEGELPVAEILKALRRIRYDGFLSLEWEKMWQPNIEEPDVVFPQYISRMKAFLKTA